MAEPAGQPDPTGGQPSPGGQPAPQDWRAGLPEELKAEKSLESFKDIGGLAKSYVEAQRMIGGSVRIPKEDAKPEEWDAFHTKLGRPAKPEEYGIVKPVDIPEGVQWNDELTSWFTKAAHKAGLSTRQAKQIINEWNEVETAKAHTLTKEIGTQIGKLKTEWGDQFEGRVELGVRGIERLLEGEEAKQFKTLMDSTGLGNHPLILKYAYLVGKMLKEDGYILGDGASGAMGVDSAKQKIAEINANPKHPYWVESDPGHKEAVEEMGKLFRQAGVRR